MKSKALEYFLQPPARYNCAQAVLAAYREVTGDCRCTLESFQTLGGGRAPEGICGALHAACLLCPEATPSLQAAFQAQTGALTCHALKKPDVPCTDYVALAAELLEEASKNTARPD